MNCKPGDMAVMVESGQPTANGLIVEVMGPVEPVIASFGPYWLCKAVTAAKSDIGFCLPGEECTIPDAWLRPIRGEDAGDESLDSHPIPADKVPA